MELITIILYCLFAFPAMVYVTRYLLRHNQNGAACLFSYLCGIISVGVIIGMVWVS